jgi:type IV secretion system protein VirD4
MIYICPVLLLIANWYGTHPVLINFLDHNIAICIKYALTGIISLLFVLYVFQTNRFNNRVLVNIPLMVGLVLALCQLYYMGWCLTHSPWPTFKLANFPQYLEMISQLQMPYILCSILPVVVIAKLIQVLNQNLSKNLGEIDTHGSARFATPKEMRKLNCKKGIPIGLIPKTQNANNPREYVKHIQQQKNGDILRLNPVHSVVIAPSGSGKGVGIVIPTLLDYEGPVFVTDVKSAENYYVTAAHRRSKGRQVYAFDPEKITNEQSATINILDYFDPEKEEIVTDMANIASLICPIPNSGSSLEVHFAEQALALIQCLLLYVICSADYTCEKKKLRTIYELFCLDSMLFKSLLEKIYADHSLCYGIPSRLAGSYMSIAEEELSSTLTTAQRHLRFTDTPIMDRVLSHSSINLRDIIDNKADLYLCIPVESLDTQSRVIKLILTTLFMLIRTHPKKPQVPILMLLDEFALLGNIPGLEKVFLVGRGYGVKIMAIMQSLEKIKTTYPDSWETILGSNLTIFINSSDNGTQDYISRKIGMMTIETSSRSSGESEQKSLLARASRSENEGESTQCISRALLTPDEIGILGDEIVIAFLQGKRPMLLKKICYYKDKAWKGKFGVNPLESNLAKKVC